MSSHTEKNRRDETSSSSTSRGRCRPPTVVVDLQWSSVCCLSRELWTLKMIKPRCLKLMERFVSEWKQMETHYWKTFFIFSKMKTETIHQRVKNNFNVFFFVKLKHSQRFRNNLRSSSLKRTICFHCDRWGQNNPFSVGWYFLCIKMKLSLSLVIVKDGVYCNCTVEP